MKKSGIFIHFRENIHRLKPIKQLIKLKIRIYYWTKLTKQKDEKVSQVQF